MHVHVAHNNGMVCNSISLEQNYQSQQTVSIEI